VNYVKIGPFTPRTPLTSSPPVFTADGGALSGDEIDDDHMHSSDQVFKEINKM